ncbi:PREDICTED: centrosomal protein of 78 kDa isoform X3 [Corvus brachyrhynchos]|uniref:centrosomal protein of 78 kDa isoform X3 n=1 Tax=Corvus brachyrhynchos TaxID=85066 RepID=UPI0008166DA8|nr:PREDICTED: centrosomal protein of 78 kDa isoform X3 [Corvus brachyrhynchos]
MQGFWADLNTMKLNLKMKTRSLQQSVLKDQGFCVLDRPVSVGRIKMQISLGLVFGFFFFPEPFTHSALLAQVVSITRHWVFIYTLKTHTSYAISRNISVFWREIYQIKEMIESVKLRRQCMLDFYSNYEHLCELQGSLPLKAVKANVTHDAVDLIVDHIKATDWAPLLNALRHNKTLTSIGIRSLHQHGLEESGVERYKTYFRRRIPATLSEDLTGQLCKAVRGCLSISDVLKNLELQGLLLRKGDLALLTKGLASASSLESVSLAHCPIGDGGLETVCQSIKNMATIRFVNFTACSLTWRGAEHIANVLKHQAIRRHGEAWAESLRYRRPDLENMSGLRRITLNCNMLVGDRGASVFADCLGEDLWLKALDLQQCGISNEGARSLLDALQTNTTLVVLDIRKNPLIGHVLMKNIIERVLKNGNSADTEYKWLISPSSKEALKTKPKKRTIVLGSGRKGKATIRIGLSSKKSVSPVKKNSSVRESYSPKPLAPGTKGFLPWRTAERAKRCSFRGGAMDCAGKLPVKIQTGGPVKVTVESASTSETEDTEDLEDVIHQPDLAKSLDKIDVAQYQQLQMELEECLGKLKEEQEARVKAEERLLETEIENARLRNLNISLLEVLHAQSVTSLILEDEGVLGSIENSFQKFHAFLDLLKDAGLGQLAVLAGIDQSDFGVLGYSEMNSTLSKPVNLVKEKSFEEERQEHTQNSKNRAGDMQLSLPSTFQSQMVVNNTFSSLGEIQELQAAGQQYQPGSWKENEAQTINQNKEDKPRSSTPVLSERRVKQNEHAKGRHSARQLATSMHSSSDSSVQIKSDDSRISSDLSSEKSKNSSSKKYIPVANETATPSIGVRGDKSRLQAVNVSSGTDTVGSGSEIQGSMQSVTSN